MAKQMLCFEQFQHNEREYDFRVIKKTSEKLLPVRVDTFQDR